MVIVTYKAGRLGNRLFHFSNFLVNSRAHDYKLIYPFFDEYARYFPYFDDKRINNQGIFLSFTRAKAVDRAVKLLVRYLFSYKLFLGRHSLDFGSVRLVSIYKEDQGSVEYDLNDPRIVNNRGQILLLNGWLYRDRKHAAAYRDYLKEVFRPRAEYLSRIDSLLAGCRTQGEVVVGIHIRRGDYRDYKGGQHYLDDQVYLDRMRELEKILAARGQSCVFLICSDESGDLSAFAGLKTVAGAGDLITDLYSLSRADYLIGAPSTFAMWASFYGAVPLLFINNKKSDMALSDFLAVRDL